MKQRILLLCLAITATGACAQPAPQTAPASVPKTKEAPALVERVGNTGFIQLRAESFRALTPRQQQLGYWLTQASIAIDPIIYDQLSRFAIRQKRLLEEIVSHSSGVDPAVMRKVNDYTKLFWANRGNHNELTSQKFLPEFTAAELQQAALAAQKNGAFKTAAYDDLPPLNAPDGLNKELQELGSAFFDATFEPMITAKSPEGGKDIIQASSNTFYQGLTLQDLLNVMEQHPLNSRLIRGADGKLQELPYRAGTPDGSITPSLYTAYLKKANEYLARAQQFAEPQQAKVIGDLIRYYQTGDFADWLKFGEDWVQDDATVDFANGFIEVYRDARGAKGSSQSFVSVTDRPVTDLITKLAANAEYFEQKAPWSDQYKKTAIKPPVVKAVETLIETGDFHVSTVGDNLPNENQIHEKFGTKNFLYTGSSRALNSAGGFAALEEFAASPEEIALGRQYGQQAGDLMTAMHEVIGHGSGKLSARVAPTGAERYLKEYFSTLEEARADLMALWNAFDPKLKELGLVGNDQEPIAKTMYNTAARAALVQLRSIPRGSTVEEDHQRDRQLISRYVQDRVPGSIEQFDRNRKTYIRVVDYQKMRQGVGMLLAELMRIKAEGDYAAIKALVDKYGVHFDPALRDQVVARYKKLNLPSYWAGVNPKLTEAAEGTASSSVTISYPRDVMQQYLGYAAMYDPNLNAPAPPASAESHRHKRPPGEQK